MSEAYAFEVHQNIERGSVGGKYEPALEFVGGCGQQVPIYPRAPQVAKRDPPPAFRTFGGIR